MNAAMIGEYPVPHWLSALVVLGVFVGLPVGIYLLRIVKRGMK
jgi:hypothetical protein